VSWIGGTAHIAEAPPRTRRRLTSDLVHCCAVKSAQRREPWHSRARLRFCLAKCNWGSQSFQSIFDAAHFCFEVFQGCFPRVSGKKDDLQRYPSRTCSPNLDIHWESHFWSVKLIFQAGHCFWLTCCMNACFRFSLLITSSCDAPFLKFSPPVSNKHVTYGRREPTTPTFALCEKVLHASELYRYGHEESRHSHIYL